jgi:Protein of unknown function (DUF760)
MSNLSHPDPDNIELSPSENLLWQYVQSMSPETVSQLSRPGSKDVVHAITKTITAILGNLSDENFNTLITTDRDELGHLLGSAMIDGYFLRNIEQRLELEKYLLKE